MHVSRLVDTVSAFALAPKSHVRYLVPDVFGADGPTPGRASGRTGPVRLTV